MFVAGPSLTERYDTMTQRIRHGAAIINPRITQMNLTRRGSGCEGRRVNMHFAGRQKGETKDKTFILLDLALALLLLAKP